MNIMNLNEMNEKLKGLNNFDLEKVAISNDLNTVTLYFSYADEEESKTILVLNEVIHIISSKQPPNKDGYYFVGEVWVKDVDNKENLLKELSYGFINEDSSVATNDTNIFHFHLEGEVVLDVIASKVKFKRYRGKVLD